MDGKQNFEFYLAYDICAQFRESPELSNSKRRLKFMTLIYILIFVHLKIWKRSF